MSELPVAKALLVEQSNHSPLYPDASFVDKQYVNYNAQHARTYQANDRVTGSGNELFVG